MSAEIFVKQILRNILEQQNENTSCERVISSMLVTWSAWVVYTSYNTYKGTYREAKPLGTLQYAF
jgi:hypothetical protein